MAESGPYTAPAPQVESVEDLWCWANKWGDVESHRAKVAPAKLSQVWARGYEAAIDDFMRRIEEMGVTFEQAKEAWRTKWMSR